MWDDYEGDEEEEEPYFCEWVVNFVRPGAAAATVARLPWYGPHHRDDWEVPRPPRKVHLPLAFNGDTPGRSIHSSLGRSSALRLGSGATASTRTRPAQQRFAPSAYSAVRERNCHAASASLSGSNQRALVTLTNAENLPEVELVKRKNSMMLICHDASEHELYEALQVPSRVRRTTAARFNAPAPCLPGLR
jgi:hypothetical protein